MKKGVVSFVLCVCLVSTSVAFSQMKIEAQKCYQIAFSTIALSPIHLYGKSLDLKGNDIYFIENDGRTVGNVKNIGYFILEAPEEKCKGESFSNAFLTR